MKTIRKTGEDSMLVLTASPAEIPPGMQIGFELGVVLSGWIGAGNPAPGMSALLAFSPGYSRSGTFV